jgi:hypothetical protein
MSMIDSVHGSEAAIATNPYWSQNRSRISWGAVLAGAVVAVATTLLLSLLGAAMGAGSIHALDTTSTDLTRYGIGAAIWEVINLALSMALGGYVAARLSGTHSHLDGELHGITMWGVAVLLSSALLAQAAGRVVSMAEQGAGPVVSRAVEGAGGIADTLSSRFNPSTTIDRLRQSLINSGDPTTMSHEQIGAEIATLVHSSLLDGGLSELNRNRLSALVSAQSGVTKEEAGRRVIQMENDAKASLAQLDQRVRVAADEVAYGTATAARALFTALVVGLLGALVGAWLGTRHKRVLHPAVEHVYDGPAYATRTSYETAAPTGASIYEDTGHLMSRYLRGISYPVNKQDLMRLARSDNAGPRLLHSIEGIAEGTYANANEVLRALGMAH